MVPTSWPRRKRAATPQSLRHPPHPEERCCDVRPAASQASNVRRQGRTVSLQHGEGSLRIHQCSRERDGRAQHDAAVVGEVQDNDGSYKK